MRGDTARLGSDIFQNITLGKITRPSSVSAGHPCACPWQLQIPPWHKHSSCWAHRESQCEHFWLNVLKSKVQRAQWVQIHHLQCGCMWSAPWALQGASAVCFWEGECELSEPSLCCHHLARPWFCRLSLWQQQEKLQEQDQHSLSALPAEELFWKVCELNTSL